MDGSLLKPRKMNYHLLDSFMTEEMLFGWWTAIKMPKVSTNTLCVYIIYKHYICNIQDGLIWAPVSDTHRSISSIYHHFVSMQQVISVHRATQGREIVV